MSMHASVLYWPGDEWVQTESGKNQWEFWGNVTCRWQVIIISLPSKCQSFPLDECCSCSISSSLFPRFFFSFDAITNWNPSASLLCVCVCVRKIFSILVLFGFEWIMMIPTTNSHIYIVKSAFFQTYYIIFAMIISRYSYIVIDAARNDVYKYRTL